MKKFIFISISIVLFFIICSIPPIDFSKISNNLEKKSWLIDSPFFGLRLGDKIGNLPNGYYHLYEHFEYSTPYKQIEKVVILPYLDVNDLDEVESDHRISSLTFYFKEANLDNFHEVVNTFEEKYKPNNRYKRETENLRINEMSPLVVDYKIKICERSEVEEVGVQIVYAENKNILFISYESMKILERIKKDEAKRNKFKMEQQQSEDAFNSLNRNL